MFQFPSFPTHSYVFTVRYLILHQVCSHIRKSTGLCLFTANRGLSQLVTSFIGSWCQGIHFMLLLAWTFLLNVLFSCLSFANNWFQLLFVYTLFSTLDALASSAHCSNYQLLIGKTNGLCLSTRFNINQSQLSVRFTIYSYSVFNEHFLHPVWNAGGLKWTRTTDLTLIRRAL